MFNDDLVVLGWDDYFTALFAPFADEGLTPGRVARVDRTSVLVHTATHPVDAAASPLPAIGDWVALDGDTVAAVLPRRSAFVRRDPGPVTSQQVLAANVDVAFVVAAVDREVNLRRLERMLALAWESGAVPVVVLTKADLCPDPGAVMAQVEAAAAGVDVHLTSATTGTGVDGLGVHLAGNRTVVLLGASGAGKSTLVNRLAGSEVMTVNEVRAVDRKGRHTTTARYLIVLPGGGVVIDTPGLRGVKLWDAGEGVAAAFPEIEDLAAGCRFRDCRHAGEPGCAVAGAVEPRRLDSWHRMQRELEHLAVAQDARARADAHRKDRVIHRAFKSRPHR